jgi:hypothetical protein
LRPSHIGCEALVRLARDQPNQYPSIRESRPINELARLNSAIGYITPKDMLAGHQQEIQTERDRKLEAAMEQRKHRRQQAA